MVPSRPRSLVAESEPRHDHDGDKELSSKEVEGRQGYGEIKEGSRVVIRSYSSVITLKYVCLKTEQKVIDLKQKSIKAWKQGNMRNDPELDVFKMVFRAFLWSI